MSKPKSYIDENGEALELDADWFRDAKPTYEVPELQELLEQKGKLGRPQMPDDEKKQRVTMYLDQDVIARLKEDGRGWQTRANARLREALGLKGG